MTCTGDVRYLDAGPELFTKPIAVLRRSDAVFQPLHNEKWYLLGGLHPVILRRRAVGGSLGGGTGWPALHLTKDVMCCRWIADKSFGRFKTLGLGRVLTKPRLKRLDHLRVGSHESDSSQQDDTTDEIPTIHRHASRHAIAEAVADKVRRRRAKRFDDRRNVGRQGVQRQALQPARTRASPAWVDLYRMKPGACNAPSQLPEV